MGGSFASDGGNAFLLTCSDRPDVRMFAASLGDVGLAREQICALRRLAIGWGRRTLPTITRRQPFDVGGEAHPTFVDRNRSDTVTLVTASKR